MTESRIMDNEIPRVPPHFQGEVVIIAGGKLSR